VGSTNAPIILVNLLLYTSIFLVCTYENRKELKNMEWLNGENVRIIRLNLNMKQTAMARRLGISKQLLCGIENLDTSISQNVESKLESFFQQVTDEEKIIELLEAHVKLNNGKVVK
jgi:DNA-binding XRE family transcriptional regulator